MFPEGYDIFGSGAAVCLLAAAGFWTRSLLIKAPDFDRVTTFIQSDDQKEPPFGAWARRIASLNRWAVLFAFFALILLLVRAWIV